MTRNSDMTADVLTPVEALARICRFLNTAGRLDQFGREVLEVIGRCIDAKAVSFYRNSYGDTGLFELDLLETWPESESSETALLKVEDIPPACRKKLDDGTIVYCAITGEKKSNVSGDGILIPLSLCGKPFGLILIECIKAKGLTAEVREILSAVGNIIELWLSRLNTKKRLDDLIAFIPNATIGIDVEGVATVWNPAVEEMTGWKAERIIGKGNYEYALPFYDMRRPLICDLIMNPDPRWEATYSEIKKDGDLIHSLIFTPALTGGGAFLTGTTRRFRDLNERVYGSLHIVRDITLERRSESMFKTITDYAGLGIALFSKEKALYYNERFEELLGISGREIDIQDLINAVHSEDRNEIRFHLEKMFQGIEREPLRLDLRADVGNRPRQYSSYTQMLDYEGKPTIYFVLDDTTEQKALSEKARLNELKLYHEGRLTSLGTMAAGIAHELNQPLNTIRVINDGILFGRDEGWDLDLDELYDSLEMVSRQVVRMTEVIQNIRNFAREDRDQAYNEVQVNDAVENVFSMIGRQLEAHGIGIRKELCRALPPIRSHMNRLEQVIMNLVVNARQALDASLRSDKSLCIRTGIKDGSVYIEMCDNATGIPEELLAKIFDPFFTTKEVGQGTGLGLTISQSIVAEFKGSMEAFNNEQGGATFIVTVPASGANR